MVVIQGHWKVVEELIRERGIKGCGGASCGLDALRFAAANDKVDIVEVLSNAGVVDTGMALMDAAEFDCEASVKLFAAAAGGVDNRRRWRDSPQNRASRGRTALLLLSA